MSAFESRKLASGNGNPCQTPDCWANRGNWRRERDGKSRGGGINAGRSMAAFEVFLAGYSCGTFCKRCTASLKDAWESAHSEIRLRVDPFDAVYVISNPEVIDSAMWGSCIQGRYRVEGEMLEQWGSFRLDRAEVLPALDAREKVAA